MKKILFSFLILFITHTAFAAPDHYSIYIDAGSSGSRLHILKFQLPTGYPIIETVYTEKTSHALSDYANNPEKAANSLKILLNHAERYIVERNAKVQYTDINVLGTGGMRALSDKKQKAIYSSIKNYIKNNYHFSVGDIKTISGKMEGVYGWLDINYLLGNFKNHQPTVGSIDMGGASTQITFATNNNSKPEDSVEFEISDDHYHIFSKGLDGLGQDLMRKKMKTYSSAANCFPQNFYFGENSMGTFDFNSCATIYSGMIQNENIASKIIPVTGQSFIAYSGVYHTFTFFNADKNTEQAFFESSIKQVCSQTWQELQLNYPNISKKYLSGFCANGIYQDQLIYNTYQIKASQLSVANQINDEEINWTLGALLFGLQQKVTIN